MKKKISFTFFIILVTTSVYAQSFFNKAVLISNKTNGLFSAICADIDGDGDMDLLSASSADDKIAWYENMDGDGDFGNQNIITTYADGANSVFATDIDGDGDMDVLSASSLDDKLAWYENTDGYGNFGSQQIITTNADYAMSVFAADIDGDGDMDVLSASSSDDKIAWYENTDGNGNFGSQQIITTNTVDARSVYSVDLDGDGDMDVLSASTEDDKIAWYENTDGYGEFGSQQVITTSADYAISVFAADIDGDGDMDVLSASSSDDKIAWYENTDGYGDFGSQQIITTNADYAMSVFAADIDGDGDTDVLSASAADDKIAWYENTDGNGNFGSQQIITTNAEGAVSVFAADIDGDGDMDVLSASNQDDKIAWYENFYGSGNFSFQKIITSDVDDARSVYSADIDGDGDMDVLSASWGDDKIAWFENIDGNGDFGSQQIITTSADGAESVYSADMDGDGDMDVISVSSVDDVIAWYENTEGNGDIWSPHGITSSAGNVRSVFVEDIDGDGDMDVISGGENVAWHKNMDGNGNIFNQQIITANVSIAWSVFATDLDGDGDMDVLSASTDNKIAWYENTDGSGVFGSQQIITTNAFYAKSVFASDLDGDGDMDVLSASYADDKIAWYENTDGNGNFGSQQIIATDAHAANAVYAADFDGDGDIDVISAGNEIRWYENTDGNGNFGQPLIIYNGEEANSVISEDIDGDGDMDVIFDSGSITWLENIGGSEYFGHQQIITTDVYAAQSVYSADIDSDGDMDVLSASFADDKIAWYENTDGNGNFGAQQIITTSADGATSVFATDIDGDGNIDVLSSSKWEDKIAWYKNTDGNGNFGSQQVITTSADVAVSVFAADIDGDGDMDVLSASAGDDKIAWYENTDGNGNFGSQQIITTLANNAQSVFAADIDGDGDLDVLSASPWDSKIAWYENTDGSGNFGTQQIITIIADGAESVYSADLDGDGDMDVLSAGNYTAWYENMDGNGNFGSQQIISSGHNYVYAADINGDGDIDILSASGFNTQIAWYENTDGNGNFGSQQAITTYAWNTNSVYSVDLDGDGDIDVLSASAFNDKIAWYENTIVIISQPQNQNICPNSNSSFTIDVNYAETYQWQVDEGNGFNNLSNNNVYSGVDTDLLNISTASISMNGFQYRCVVYRQGDTITSLSAILTVEDLENPVIICIENQEVQANATHTYTIIGNEFDPTETSDNCEVVSVYNDYNNQASLADATLPEGTTLITWTVNDAAGNDSICSFEVFVDEYVGVKEFDDYGISVFPNPTKSIINFDFGNRKINKLEILDLSGNLILEKKVKVQNMRLDISIFSEGVYILSIFTDSEIIRSKIVKK